MNEIYYSMAGAESLDPAGKFLSQSMRSRHGLPGPELTEIMDRITEMHLTITHTENRGVLVVSL